MPLLEPAVACGMAGTPALTAAVVSQFQDTPLPVVLFSLQPYCLGWIGGAVVGWFLEKRMITAERTDKLYATV